MFRPSHFAAVVLFALFASVVFGITQRETPRAHDPLRNLLLCALRGLGNRAQLGHVPDRTLNSCHQLIVARIEYSIRMHNPPVGRI